MACPKEFLKKKVAIDSVVKDHAFFSSKPVNEWTFENYIKESNPEDLDLDHISLLLRKYKESLQSLARMRSLDRTLKSYIGNLKKKDYTETELRSFLPKSTAEGTSSTVTINMKKATIVSANDNSKVVINNTSSKKRKGKGKERDEGRPKTVASNEIDTSYTTNYIINGTDILPLWNNYKRHCENFLLYESPTVETDTAKLLSQTHIMLIKRDEIDQGLKETLGSEVVEIISNKVKEYFGIEDDNLPHEIEKSLKDIIKELINKKISSREASSKVMSLCSNKMNTSVDDVLFITRNIIERIPQKKYNHLIQESNLSCTYVDALIRPLVEYPDDDAFLIWSNLKVQDDCAERPDICGMALIDTQFKNIICVGEVKGEDKICDNHATLCDLMKIGCFSKEAIDNYSNNGILGIHVVGFQVTIYVTVLLTEGLYIMQEISSVRLPASVYDMKSFIANVEDLLPIKAIYKKCMGKNENIPQWKKKGPVYKELLKYIKVGKNRKRRCPLVVNH